MTASLLGLVGSALLYVSGTTDGWQALADGWQMWLPWLMLLALAVLGLVTRDRAIGGTAAVVAASFAGGSIVAVASALAPILRAPFDRAVGASPWDYWSEVAWDLAGLALILAGGIGVIVWLWRFVMSEFQATRGATRSPFRIEVLVTLAFLSTTLLLTSLGTTEGLVAAAASGIPLVVVLAMLLRSPGALSLGTVAGVALTCLVFPTLVLWLDPSGYQTFVSTPLDSLAVAPLGLLLIAVVVLWNLGVPHVQPLRDSDNPPGGLDPWAGVAFILAFVPFLSLPAVAIGHVSYDRLKNSDAVGRGRLFAASAIVLGLLNAFLIVVIWTGLAAAAGAAATELGAG